MRVRRGRGMGATGAAGGSSGHGSCGWWYWNFNPAALVDPACSNDFPTLPAPPAPSISLSTVPSAATQPGAVYAGQDASGNAVYALPQTAQQSQDQLTQQLQQFFASLPAGQNPPPAAAPCSSWYSFLDPTCPSNLNTGLVFVAVAAVGVVVFGAMLSGGRRK